MAWGAPMLPACSTLPQLSMPRLESEVVVHHEANAVGRSPGDNRPRLVQGGRERLLADDVYSTFTCHRTQLLMRLRRRDDVDEIRPFAVEHLGGIGVYLRHPESPRHLLAAAAVAVAEGHEFRLRMPLPRIVVELAEVPCPHRHALERPGHTSWRCHRSTALVSIQLRVSASNATKCGIVRWRAKASESAYSS